MYLYVSLRQTEHVKAKGSWVTEKMKITSDFESQQIALKQEHITSLSALKTSLKHEQEAWVAEREKEANELTLALQQAKDELKQLKNNNQNLPANSNSNSNSESKQSEIEKTKNPAKNDYTNEKVGQLQTENKVLMEQNNDLTKQIQTLSIELKDLKLQTELKNGNEKEVESSPSNPSSPSSTDVNVTEAKKDSSVADHKESVELRAKITELNTENSNLVDKNEALNQRNLELTNKYELVTQEKKKIVDKLANLANLGNTSESEQVSQIRNLTKENAVLSGKNKELNINNEKLTSQTVEIGGKMEELSANHQELLNKHSELSGKNENLLKEHSEITAKQVILAEEHEQLNKLLIEKSGKNEELNKLLEELKNSSSVVPTNIGDKTPIPHEASGILNEVCEPK